MNCEWFGCPYNFKGKYVRCDHGSNPFILLEAVASQDLWIWHVFFGVAGSNNDINVLYNSPLFNDLKTERASEISFVANGITYPWGYYLVNRIYSELATLVKMIPEPVDDDHKRILYKLKQESARKDMEQAFVDVEPRRSSRPHKLPTNLNDFIVEGKVKFGVERVVNYSNLSKENFCYASSLNKSVEPRTYQEAILDVNWVNAMNEEMKALNENQTWTLTDLPAGRKAIGCKWVYKIKYKSNGEIERYKARLVAKGYSQREGIDYEETFSPVVKMVTVRCLIALAVKNKWNLYQLDVNNAFLYGSIEDDVYMSLPQGYFSKSKTKVCKLVKSLYSLKQALRKWNEKLVTILSENGFIQSQSDHSLFIKSKGDLFVALVVYVDDIFLTVNDEEEIQNFKQFLSSKFQIKDLGKLKYFLGIEVLDENNSIVLSQRKHCLELLQEFGMLGCKHVSIPMEANHVMAHAPTKKDPVLTNITGFQKLVGKLIYLSHTRPDIAYFMHCLSQRMHAPLKSNLKDALKVLRYLKGSPGKGIKFTSGLTTSESSGKVTGYSDADWAKCLIIRKSFSGYCIFFNNCLIFWKSKKQATLSKSSTESEYRAMGSTTCEIMWIIKILKDLKINVTLPVSLFCDNKNQKINKLQ
ncbi:putative RNA-directed DNA polymerase [Tanacetum coccineum]